MRGGGLVERLREEGLLVRLREGRIQVREARSGAKERLLPIVLEHEVDLTRELIERQADRPRLNQFGDLVIPFAAPLRYRWWDGGQSIEATLRELQVPREIWERYSDTSYQEEE